jgi:hypothetical protein
MTSTILNVFPSESAKARLVLARETSDQGADLLVLRQESLSPHVGWFVQSRIAIEPDQVAALKMTLTSSLVRESSVRKESPEILSFQVA